MAVVRGVHKGSHIQHLVTTFLRQQQRRHLLYSIETSKEEVVVIHLHAGVGVVVHGTDERRHSRRLFSLLQR